MRRAFPIPPPAPPERTRSDWWSRAVRGELPAEVLTVRDREDLFAELHERGWTDRQIAEHTSTTTYTTTRILERLGLAPN